VSKTELEEDLRATFERAAASVPLAPDLADRATSGAQRAQRRSWIVYGAAAAAVAVIATVGFSLHGSSPSTPAPAAVPAAPVGTAATTAVTAQTVTGTWRATKMDGFTSLKAARPDDPILTFNADGTWTGSDGCNGLGGTYSIGQRGEFTAKIGPQRLAGCSNVPHTLVLQQTKRISSDKTTLQFYAADGREVARYARAR
jgi:heat shock protein HslJ